MIVNFDKDKKKKFLRYLQYKLPPFDRFVSKGDIPEYDEIFPSREDVLKKIVYLLNSSKHSILIPIVGNMGSGKTHFLQSLKNNYEIDSYVSFISTPRSKRRFFYNFYSEIMEDFGIDRLRDFTQSFAERYGADEKLYGFFRTQDYNKVIFNAFNALKDKYEYKDSLEQCIRVIVQHNMCRDKFTTAERWLLGELMEPEDLFTLNINQDLAEESMAFTMLKLLIENDPKGIIVLIDDFYKSAVEFNEIMDMDDDYEDDWTNSLEKSNENENTFLEEEKSEEENKREKVTDYDIEACDPNEISLQNLIKKILINIQKSKIVITIERNYSKEIMQWFRTNVENFSKFIHNPIIISNISIEDTYVLFLERLKNFSWKNKIYIHPVADRDFIPKRDWWEYYEYFGDDLFYPLNKKIIERIYEVSAGNVRTILKNFKKIFDSLIFEEITPEELGLEYNDFVKI